MTSVQRPALESQRKLGGDAGHRPDLVPILVRNGFPGPTPGAITSISGQVPPIDSAVNPIGHAARGIGSSAHALELELEKKPLVPRWLPSRNLG